MELLPFLVKLFGPTLARILFAYVLKDRLELEFIRSGDVAETMADSLDIGGVVDRLTDGDRTAKRNAHYIFDKIGDEIARKLIEVFKLERHTMSEGEMEQVVEAAKDTMNRWSLPLLLETAFDPIQFRKALRRKPPKFPAWSEQQMTFYERLLERSAQLVFAVAEQVPHFTRDTTARLLQNENELLADLAKALQNQERILAETYGRQQANESQLFEADYRSQLAAALDKLRLFGVPLIDGARQPLTVAFVKMKMTMREQGKREPGQQLALFDVEREEAAAVEDVFAHHRRLVVVAREGYGKTTLLKWAAVQIARNMPDVQIDAWQGCLPFFVRLRDYARQPLPPIARLPLGLKAKEIEILEDSIPAKWAIKRLREKRGVIFLDGLDEVNEQKQQEALAWAEQILQLEPETIVILSGRPDAINRQEIEPELSRLGFQFVTLKEMDDEMITAFVQQWHEAIVHTNCKYHDKEGVPERQEKMLETLEGRAELRGIATTPLVCAMLCALNLTKLGELPRDRIRLYGECIDLLLKRDELREVDLSDYGVSLRAENARRLLARLAYWMMEREQSTVEREDAERVIDNEELDGPKIANYLAERSGILQKQSEEEFDFLHRSFQEFLAAQQIVEDHEVLKVVRQYGGEKAWRETICLLAGFVKPKDQQELITALLEKARQEPEQARFYHLLAWDFWELLDETTHPANQLMQNHVHGLCKNGGRVLNLSETQVSDVSALANLTNLQSLDLMSTRISDISPLASLTNLQSLYLMNTQVSDVLALVSLTNLQSLLLMNTQVSDVSALAGLTNLESLYLSYSQVSDVSTLAGLTNLQLLHLSYTQVSDVSTLADLTNLQSLYLGGTQVSDVSALASLTSLQSLYLSSTPVSDVSALASLTNLQLLDLSYTQVSDVSALASLTNLQSLYLSATQVNDVSALAELFSSKHVIFVLAEKHLRELLPQLLQIPALKLRITNLENINTLASLTNLQSLDLMGTRVGDISALADLTNLQSLDLMSTEVSDVSTLASLTNLQSLNLNLTSVSDVSTLDDLTNLQSLYLSYTQVSDVSALAGLTNLQSLNLNFTPVSDVSTLDGLTNLQSLYLSYTQVSDVSALASLTNLQSLYLRESEVNDISALDHLTDLTIRFW